MKMKYFFLALLCFLIVPVTVGTAFGQRRPAADRTSPKAPAVYPRVITVADGFQAELGGPSRIEFPRNATRAKKYPVVVFLPATGAEASMYYDLYQEVFSELPPFISIITPEAATEKDWSSQGFEAATYRYENRILADLERLKRQGVADTSRVIIFGFSMGGDIGWALVQRYPEVFSGAILGGTRTSWSEKGSIAKLKDSERKLFFVMGTDERADRLNGLNATLKALGQNGVDFRYERTPGAHVRPTPELFAEGINFLLE